MPVVSVPIVNNSIIEKVKKAASFVAKEAYNDGGSLYDSIRITDQDNTLLEDFIAEAKHNLVSAFSEMCSLTQAGISFSLTTNSVPAMADSIIEECQEYISHFCCWRWFLLRYSTKVEEYKAKASANLDNLNIIIYAKQAPAKETENTFNSGLIRIGNQETEQSS